MRNRAKCKLCGDTIESYANDDTIECSCGEITISGGAQKLITWAKDYTNFLRIDDFDNEIEVKFVDKEQSTLKNYASPNFEKQKLLEEFKNLIDYYENMKLHQVTNKDLADFMRLILLIMESH